MTQTETSAARGLTDLFCNPRYAAGDCIGNCADSNEDHGWGSEKIWGIMPDPWNTRDNANELVILRSPPFSNPVRIEFDIMGGSGLTPVHEPASDTDIHVGYLGVCLRQALNGNFLRCYSMDCGTQADGWTSGSLTCDNRKGPDDPSTGTETWTHVEWDVGHFVTDSVTQYTLELIDNYGGGSWAHIELQDVHITASLADESPNQFYSASLPSLQPLVTVQSASGSSCVATGAACDVVGSIQPSRSGGDFKPPPFGLQGYTFGWGNALKLNDPAGVDIDETWTVDCFIQTPFECTNCDNQGHDPSPWTGWHTLVRGLVEDHPALLSVK